MKVRAHKRRNGMQLKPIMDFLSMRNAFIQHNIDEAHIRAIMKSVIKDGVTQWEDLVNMPLNVIELLQKEFSITTSSVTWETYSDEDSTKRFTTKLYDGNILECVILQNEKATSPKHHGCGALPQLRKPSSCKSSTLCVSAQAFCQSDGMHIVSDLTSGEILEQVYHATKRTPIRNVLFMGDGDPLDNYEEVVESIRGMMDTRTFHIASHRICIYTPGIVNRIKQLAFEVPGVNLALSVGARNFTRQRLILSHDIIEDAEFFYKTQKSRVNVTPRCLRIQIDYNLICGENNSDKQAEAVGVLLMTRRDFIQLNFTIETPKHNILYRLTMAKLVMSAN